MTTAINEFVSYVKDFYGEGGIYDMGATEYQIREATQSLITSGAEVCFDSIDRERVRDILINDFGLSEAVA
jgi:hypothetical protein